MKLATIRLNPKLNNVDANPIRTAVVRVEQTDQSTTGEREKETYTVIDGYSSLSDLLARTDGEQALKIAADANGDRGDFSKADLAPVLPAPRKIICVGVNYLPHIAEMGRTPEPHPTIFAKFANTLIGARDLLQIPRETDSFDYEGELAIIIGKTVRRANREQAKAAIFGYTVANDGSVRDWQNRTPQWDQGKMWDGSTPLGPVAVTPDELPDRAQLITKVDGAIRQKALLSERLFDSVALVCYISEILTLEPGDIILSGTPGGVGHGMNPPSYLQPGQLVEISIDGIGTLENRTIREV